MSFIQYYMFLLINITTLVCVKREMHVTHFAIQDTKTIIYALFDSLDVRSINAKQFIRFSTGQRQEPKTASPSPAPCAAALVVY